MSDKIKQIIGDELYSKLLEKGLKSTEFDIVTDWIPKSRFNEVNSKLRATEEKMLTYDSQLNETKKLLNESTEFKTKYSELENKFKSEIGLKDKEIVNVKKKFLVESSLTKEGAKHTSLLMKEIDLDKITFDGDTPIGLSDIIKDLKTNYNDLFVVSTTKNSSQQAPKSNNDNGGDDEEYSKYSNFGKSLVNK